MRKPGAKHPSRHKIGDWPGMSVKDARKEAKAIKADPAAHFACNVISEVAGDTVAAVAAEWLKRDQAGHRRVGEVERMLKKDVLPAWGDRPLAAIRKRDVIALVDGIMDRNAPIQANRVLAVVKRMLRWACARDIVEADVSASVLKPAAEVPRDRVLDAAELRAVWHATEGDSPYGAGVRLLILTLARRAEVFGLRVDEIDRGERPIRLPRERAKTGAARSIPLSEPALEIIDRLPGLGPYVFSVDGRRPYNSFTDAKPRIDARIAKQRGAPLAPWRLHDFRRVGATNLQRLRFRLEVIEAVLGHTSGSRAGIVGIYQKHKFETESRAALEAWGREVERIVGGESARVVPLRPAG